MGQTFSISACTPMAFRLATWTMEFRGSPVTFLEKGLMHSEAGSLPTVST